MKKASEYRRHAEECRVLARQMPEGPQREQLLEMARTWDNLAQDRNWLVERHPELNIAEHRTKEDDPSPSS
ncbi:MAG TPA: hypothetical protein VEZ16_16905 [Microvirga sp.]|nr:hypothetical protein [Microvirga sp.]